MDNKGSYIYEFLANTDKKCLDHTDCFIAVNLGINALSGFSCNLA
jgi:hypothetical protein